jgi:hypothetical protein
MFFNGNARVVPGGLAHAGQAVEKGAFSGVWIADDGNGCGHTPTDSNFFNWDRNRTVITHSG